mmetsp:Transcript_35245/g.99748  ORF Transcript_35245/g.99748 Transcript_35245/m.99748 type:complete len:200 (+) Transcript_35245:356-955(+)
MHVLAFSRSRICHGITSPGSTAAIPSYWHVDVRLAMCGSSPGSLQKLQSVSTATNTVRSLPTSMAMGTWTRSGSIPRDSEMDFLKAFVISGAAAPTTARTPSTTTSPCTSGRLTVSSKGMQVSWSRLRRDRPPPPASHDDNQERNLPPSPDGEDDAGGRSDRPRRWRRCGQAGASLGSGQSKYELKWNSTSAWLGRSPL